MEQVSKQVAAQDYEAALISLAEINISTCSYDQFKSESSKILTTFLTCCKEADDSRNKIALKCLNLLKRSCAMGESFQNEIISKENFLTEIRTLLVDDKVQENIRISCLQLLANLCVQNRSNQEKVLEEFKEYLMKSIEANTSFTNASTMIVYNAFIYKANIGLDAQQLLAVLLENVEVSRQEQKEVPEFVSIFLEYLMCESNEIVDGYERINFEKRILFLRYLTEYIREDDRRHRPLQQDLFKHLLNDFKQKSDRVLKTDQCDLDNEDSEEVFTLLTLLADATCVEPYGSFLRQDGALFLNVGCLLRQLQSVGNQEGGNIFTPVQKIEEILKVKQGNSELNIELDISFSLKSSLVKALANLSYKNKKNQNLAREMEIMAAVLECTNLDARNPFIKEWSILAIHNLCDDNLENQQFISSLKKIGNADNSLITDYTSGGGTIRIRDGSTPSSRGQ